MMEKNITLSVASVKRWLNLCRRECDKTFKFELGCERKRGNGFLFLLSTI